MITSHDTRLAECLAQYGRFISYTLRIYERDDSLREDLQQDVALALWRALPNFRGDASMKTFIARITHNIGVSHIRKAVKNSPPKNLSVEIVDNTPTPEDTASKSNRMRILMVGIDKLSLSQRQLITLYLEDFNHREIGDILGISEGNASVRLTRARKNLINIMDLSHE